MMKNSLMFVAVALAAMSCDRTARISPRGSKLVGKWEFDATLDPNYKPSGFETSPSPASNESGSRFEFEPNGNFWSTGNLLEHSLRMTGTWQVVSEDAKQVTITLESEFAKKDSTPIKIDFIEPDVVHWNDRSGASFYKRVK